MRIESMQSIAGGTGRTSLVIERALEDRNDDERVLVINTCRAHMLDEILLDQGFSVIGDLWQLFQPGGFIGLGRKLEIEGGLIVQSSDRKFDLSDAGLASIEAEALANASENLLLLSRHFDTCLIDCARSSSSLSRIVTAVSNLVHYFPRNLPAASVEDWKANFWDDLPVSERPHINIESDRSEWHENWVNDLGLSLMKKKAQVEFG